MKLVAERTQDAGKNQSNRETYIQVRRENRNNKKRNRKTVDHSRDGGRLKRACNKTCFEYKLLSSETDAAGVQLLFIAGWVIAIRPLLFRYLLSN